MPKKFGTKRQQLERFDFPFAPQRPLILTVAEAHGIDSDTYRLKYVTWWTDGDGDSLPAGFTSMRVNGPVPDDETEYSITVLEQHAKIVEYHYLVPADTLVLAFYGQLPEIDHA